MTRRAATGYRGMHYCFLSTGSWRKNGTLARYRELGGALADLGVRVTFVMDEDPYNRAELRLHAAIDRVFVPAGTGWRQFGRRRRAVEALAPDFVGVTPAPKLWLSLRGLAAGIRVVGDWDEWPAIRPYYGLVKRTAYRTADRWLRRRAALHVVASAYLQGRFKADFGIDAAHIPHAPFDPPYADGPDLFGGAPTAVYLGTFFDFYDHDVVLAAAAEYRRRWGECPRVELIGDGPDLPRWRRFADEQGLAHITFPGHLAGPDLFARLRHARALLFPMRQNEVNACRCPGKLYNYMQARRPIVATPTGEIPRIVGGRATFVPCDPASFAFALRDVLSAPRAPDVAYELPTWADRARQLLAALDRVSGPR